MLSIELDKEHEQIYFHGSPEKLRWLAERIQAIANEAEKSGSAHDHFMTPEWGGEELTSELQGGKESHSTINQLIVYGWGHDGKNS